MNWVGRGLKKPWATAAITGSPLEEELGALRNNASCEYKSSCLTSEWGPSSLHSLRPGFHKWVLIKGSPGL